MIRTGLERFCRNSRTGVEGLRVGLLSNQASVDSHLVHSRELLYHKLGNGLCCLFSPQHGFFGEKQDNMIESGDMIDPVTNLPVFSLYGKTRKPTKQMFDHIDVLIIDMVDVGTRVYTFLYTMAYCLEMAARWGKRVLVLDRPNPIGGVQVEGNVLVSSCRSFVGRYPLPMRHGLSFGELACYINEEFSLNAELQVIVMEGWKRDMYFRDTGLPWIFPSPNMPTPETAIVYPGQVIWEGTTVSEGRGTTLPFELVGAPYWQPEKIIDRIADTELPGCVLRPIIFEPTSGKWAGTTCHGFHLHVTDHKTFMPYRTSIALLQAVYLLYPEDFSYKPPPYEYEYEKMPMDMIIGDQKVRKGLESGIPVIELEAGWQESLAAFRECRQKYLLYDNLS
ncbi:MAG: hypothetical protein CSA26_08825 [Desulfobacterales bacterium]|nr:MAG: hypothetical protein CSA26_08825 [Desulfobacterales bacterium]